MAPLVLYFFGKPHLFYANFILFQPAIPKLYIRKLMLPLFFFTLSTLTLALGNMPIGAVFKNGIKLTCLEINNSKNNAITMTKQCHINAKTMIISLRAFCRVSFAFN